MDENTVLANATPAAHGRLHEQRRARSIVVNIGNLGSIVYAYHAYKYGSSCYRAARVCASGSNSAAKVLATFVTFYHAMMGCRAVRQQVYIGDISLTWRYTFPDFRFPRHMPLLLQALCACHSGHCAACQHDTDFSALGNPALCHAPTGFCVLRPKSRNLIAPFLLMMPLFSLIISFSSCHMTTA